MKLLRYTVRQMNHFGRPAVTSSSPNSPDQLMVTVVFLLLTGASLSPVLLTPIPAMVDYLNHLARMYILSQAGTPDANPHYEVAWAFYPNLAMDLIVPQIARFISVENAARTFLLLSQLLIISGALALERAEKGASSLLASQRSYFSTACPSRGAS